MMESKVKHKVVFLTYFFPLSAFLSFFLLNIL